ncbi:hypothetical protein PEX2_031050 [Penicillium expansum]|uniref:Uncharacterized protein n=1 Tax=Penicillium expansum TaxID=27334 RepID=A0A0A2JKN8_PENEN|nr:hypothetical protein PEX2_031050 [Penicillium expansum]KGO55401.1 hypothetical protein PEX2_031050 [Penicillium expansum]
MSQSPSSPLNKVKNFFRRSRTGDGSGTIAPPPPAPEGVEGAATPAKAPSTSKDKKRKLAAYQGDATNDGNRTPMQKRLDRARGTLGLRRTRGISTDLNLPKAPEQDPEEGAEEDSEDDSEDPEENPEAKLPNLTASPRSPGMYTGRLSSKLNPDKIHILDRTPKRAKINHYQATGAEFENWMANTNPAGPACPVRQSTLTLAALVEARPPNEPLFKVWETSFVPPPREIRESLRTTNLPRNPKSDDYRHSKLQRNKMWTEVSTYEHCIVGGAIVVHAAFRHKWGPQWSDIALALYKRDSEIDTLQYVFMVTVENEETLPLVGRVLYRENNLPGPRNRSITPAIHTWNLNTPQFQQILGSQMGRAVARLVLATWPAGTHQIPTIHTWFLSGNLHMRFDIARIGSTGAPPPRAPPPATPPTPSPAARKGQRGRKS